MGWQDIDFFEMEPLWFSEELHSVIVPLFNEGSKRLAEWEKERKESVDKMMSEAKDDDEQSVAHDLASYEEWRNKQRAQVLGAAGLHYLYSTLKSALKQSARYFDSSHPRSIIGYEGKSELDRLKEEFAQRFGINFEKSHLFSSIRELVLARNAGIHDEAFGEYITNVTRPRFCKGGEFHVDRDGFTQILDETEKFFEWVVKEMLPLRKAQGPCE